MINPHRSRRLLLKGMGVSLAWLATSTFAWAQWPDKPIRIVVPYPAGGLTDIVTRSFADDLGRELGQAVVVENKSGAGGAIGLQSVLQAPRDGHTIALVVPATMVTLPLTSSSYKIKPLQDFEPITAAVDTYMTLVVSPSIGVKTLPEFVEYARKNDGKINYGTPGAGTSFHLNNLLLARKLGIKPAHIPYQGEIQFLNDVQSGVLQYALVSSSGGRPYIDGGKVIPLGMTHERRSPSQPSIPTFIEQGVDFTTDGWVGYAVAAGTPTAVMDKLNAAMTKVLRSASVSKRLTDMGFSVVANERTAFRATIVANIKVYEELLKSGDIKTQP